MHLVSCVTRKYIIFMFLKREARLLLFRTAETCSFVDYYNKLLLCRLIALLLTYSIVSLY